MMLLGTAAVLPLPTSQKTLVTGNECVIRTGPRTDMLILLIWKEKEG